MMATAPLTVRLATAADAGRVWTWRNDPNTRGNSLQSAAIPWPQHEAWFAARLADPDTILYIIEEDTAGPVAHVRYNRHDGDAAEVHITVAPDCRGRGFGTAALQVTLRAAMETLQVRRIDAVVKQDNVASRRAFERVGFVRDAARSADGLIHLRFSDA